MNEEAERWRDRADFWYRRWRTLSWAVVVGKQGIPAEFIPCGPCAAKPGSPYLCRPCLENRGLISRLGLQKALLESQKTYLLKRAVTLRKVIDAREKRILDLRQGVGLLVSRIGWALSGLEDAAKEAKNPALKEP